MLMLLYREPYISYCSDTILFRDPGEWGRELARTGSIGWRLSAVNKDFKMSTRYRKNLFFLNLSD